jgi:hypothetical protein
MKFIFSILALLLLVGCSSSGLVTLSEEMRRSMGLPVLQRSEFYLDVPMQFVSLRKGEIVGDDIFKYEKKKKFFVDPDTVGKLVDAGPRWVTVEFNDGIRLTFQWDPVEDAYRTPGWGTITVQGERFDVQQGVMAGRFVNLLIRPPP